MKNKRRTQVERSAATRDALIVAGRSLFAAHGYHAVGTDAIARAAGVSRGALYYQFEDKAELFAAVFETVEADVIARIGVAVEKASDTDPIALMRLAASLWLDASRDPDVLRIALTDAPAVLGWARWREIGDRYGVALALRLITNALEVDRIVPLPVGTLAYVLIGMLRESALYLSAATDSARARADIGAVIDQMIESLAVVPIS